MTERLAVGVNPEGPRTLDAPGAFAVEGGFEVALTNHGDPTHVHLALDGDVADVATLADTHPFVGRDETATVRVDVPEGAAASGRLRIATGHGATTRNVDVEVREPQPVRVDESLSEPGGAAGSGAGAGATGGLSRSVLAPVAVAVGALALAAGIGALVGGPALAVAAVAVVAVGVAAAYGAYRFAA